MNVEDIIKLIYADKQLKALKKKIEDGLGTFIDTAAYCNRSAELLGRYFSESVLAMSDIERIAANDALLRDRYKDINELLDKVQRTADKAQGLSIRPQHAPYNKERADQIGQALTDKTVPEETIQRRAKSAPANMTRSMQDDFIEENAEFRSKAGLKCYIVRISDGEPCEWCDKLAGRYEYGSEPEGVYRRHDNCGCSVTYENGRQKQNVWTKRFDDPDYDKEYLKERDKIKADKNKPLNRSQKRALQEHMDIFSREQAQRLDAEKAEKNTKSITAEARKELLSQNKVDIHNSTVDKSVVSGIIETEELESIIKYSDGSQISKDVKTAIEETISVIPEHLRSRLEQFVPEIIVEEGRGFSSFIQKTNTIILDKETATNSILHELGHAWAKMDNLYEDEEFLAVLADGLDRENWGNVIPYKHPYKDVNVYVLKSDKFVVPYQGRVYADIFSVDYSEPIELSRFKEYISVGFDKFFSDPDLLKLKDPKLYIYLEGKING